MSNKVEISNNAAIAACTQLLHVYREADNAAASIGTKTARAIVSWLETTPPDLIIAATDRERVGVEPKTTEAVRLSQTRAIFRVYRDAPDKIDDILLGDRGWNAIMADVRDVVRSLKTEAAVEREVKAAAKTLGIIHKDNPEKAAEILAQMPELVREAKAAEQQERDHKRETDSWDPAKVAERIARRLIKDRNVEFAASVAAEMAEAVRRVSVETVAEREAAEA